VAGLLEGARKNGNHITREQLEEVIRTSDKQRFALSEDGLQIRANQGHSVPVELGYEAAVPPDLLYHGTTGKFLNSIRKHGLQKQARHHVHLSPTVETATAVGGRRGKPVILTIRARHAFYVTPNQVWLVDAVPPEFIEFP
jgi:putative RNA 2'-phosphotransferase